MHWPLDSSWITKLVPVKNNCDMTEILLKSHCTHKLKSCKLLDCKPCMLKPLPQTPQRGHILARLSLMITSEKLVLPLSPVYDGLARGGTCPLAFFAAVSYAPPPAPAPHILVHLI